MADGSAFPDMDEAKKRARESSSETPEEWPEPVDFLGDVNITGSPELKAEWLPDAIAPFAFDTATRMGVDPATVALIALVSCAAVITDDWQIQPKRHDDTWTEAPRIWGAIVGAPSILKSPVLRACTRPIEKLEIEAREAHDVEMAAYKVALAAWKKAKDDSEEPKHPILQRHMVENLTTEALSEVLRSDAMATQRAPARKVLVRADELAELLGNLDRYNGGKGSGDRGAFLRLFNGGHHTIDRIGRGSFSCANWSACIVGGIQPEPIQRIARQAADDGMLQRFCYAVPTRQAQGLDQTPDRSALERYGRLFPRLAALRPAQSPDGRSGAAERVVLHADAHQHREALETLLAALGGMPDTSTRMAAALGKYPGIYARLCLLFHLIDVADAWENGDIGPPCNVVLAATAAKVLAYVRNCLLPHLGLADRTMYLTPQSGHARWIAGYILSRDICRITRRDITRAYGPLRAPECERELTSVMNSLVTLDWVREEVNSNPARPPAAWTANPKLWARFKDRAEQEKEARRHAAASLADKIREDTRVRAGGNVANVSTRA